MVSEKRIRFIEIIRILVDILLIVLGTLIIVSFVELSIVPFWLSFVILCAGAILIFEEPGNRNLRVGLPLTFLGLLMTMRSLNIVSVPILRWGLGAFLLLTGAVNIYRNFRGGGVAIHKTFQKNLKNL